MTKKILWLVISCMMALSLVMASCTSTTVEEEEEEEDIVIGEEEEEEEEEEEIQEGFLPPEQPKYGGVYTGMYTRGDPMGFDEAYAVHPNVTPCFLTNSELMTGAWEKGPVDENETSWLSGFVGRVGLETGALAESWELPDDETIIYHIRQGVYWQNKAPVNGREYTAEDAAYSINRNFDTSTSYLYGAYTRPGNNPVSITATDKYTVEVKCDTALGLMVLVCGDFQWSWPKEMIDLHGDMKDWKNSCGTGPFLLTDYVPGSALTYERNPNYFMKDPLHPQNQLPYLDGVKYLIISDRSTQHAALRTGKVDSMPSIALEDAELLLEQTDLQYTESHVVRSIAFRIDKPELPFADVKVRQAMALSIDRDELIEDLYGGKAVKYSYPYLPKPDYLPYYVPYDELTDLAKDAFRYDVDKAKALLDEAGYPDGFITSVITGDATTADFLAIIKEYFAVVGITMEINVMETGAFSSTSRGRKHEEGISRGSMMGAFPFRLLEWRIESFDNHAYFDSDIIRTAYDNINNAIGIDDSIVAGELKGLVPYMLEQFIQVWCPAYEVYHMWHPWVQNYHGEQNVGYFNPYHYLHYIWIDTDMKEQMGY
ncbi:ABC transporter substrate-binding protein [Chloroflexota bacterium]